MGVYEWKANTMDLMPAGKMHESRALAKALSAEVRATLARQNMTAKDLAAQCGISAGYLGKRLRNEAPFNLNDLEAICAALGRDVLGFVAAALEAAREAESH
ncbi:helix-turn-helix DNA binding domain [Arthrobacter phage BrayBeast]